MLESASMLEQMKPSQSVSRGGFESRNCRGSFCGLVGESGLKLAVPVILQEKGKGLSLVRTSFPGQSLEGKVVWRRRKYRVKGSKFCDHFTLTSWRTLLSRMNYGQSWGLFHYKRDTPIIQERWGLACRKREQEIGFCLEKCGIKEWELFTVDNCSCQDPPLGPPKGSSLRSVIDVENLKTRNRPPHSYIRKFRSQPLT
ncbi:hypothetical protein SADUNF_Sadunf07G0071100 [Salix dunnii]|uniref:Uncharacterized protein n=1 Tax=Salix dunnii TaxID=1413687 RepID=A0A835JZR7_9ROSI|nr:hypothetical protein SADUNF_Sadunf07G0071100 [Salix dunnii]